MSRGFIKETDQEETPLVPPRAHLPAGAKNYVTPRGLRLLNEEEVGMQEEIRKLVSQSAEGNRVQINYLKAKLRQLRARKISAELVEPLAEAPIQISFGTSVRIEELGKDGIVCYQIVGVDKAVPREGRISYLSPFSKVLIGKREGESITLDTPKGPRVLKVVGIDYCEQ